MIKKFLEHLRQRKRIFNAVLELLLLDRKNWERGQGGEIYLYNGVNAFAGDHDYCPIVAIGMFFVRVDLVSIRTMNDKYCRFWLFGSAPIINLLYFSNDRAARLIESTKFGSTANFTYWPEKYL